MTAFLMSIRRRNRRQIALSDPRGSHPVFLGVFGQAAAGTVNALLLATVKEQGDGSVVVPYTGALFIDPTPNFPFDSSGGECSLIEFDNAGPGAQCRLLLTFPALVSAGDAIIIPANWQSVRGEHGQWIQPGVTWSIL